MWLAILTVIMAFALGFCLGFIVAQKPEDDDDWDDDAIYEPTDQAYND